MASIFLRLQTIVPPASCAQSDCPMRLPSVAKIWSRSLSGGANFFAVKFRHAEEFHPQLQRKGKRGTQTRFHRRRRTQSLPVLGQVGNPGGLAAFPNPARQTVASGQHRRWIRACGFSLDGIPNGGANAKLWPIDSPSRAGRCPSSIALAKHL